MQRRTCLAIVLAAGEGTRMRSATPKALHRIGGRTLLAHVLTAAKQAGGGDIAVVVGPDHEAVAQETRALAPKAGIFEQTQRRGTADAVLAARKAIARGADDILVMFADTPLVRPETLTGLRSALRRGAAVAVLGFRPADPAGYGRLLTRGEELLAIREDRDATPDERKIALCNGGLMALSGKTALAILGRIGNANSKGEFYLTDAVAIAHDMGLKAVAIETGEDDMRGINTKAQLAETEAVLQKRLRAAALDAGVTMTAPDTVFLSADTKFGKDVTIEPNVVFGPGVTVADGATIRAFSHLEGAMSARAPASGRSRGCAGRRSRRRRAHRQFCRGEGGQDRGRRQGQSSRLHRRRAGGRGRQYRRRHHHLQLRRRRQAPYRHRQRRLHRLEFVLGGAGQDRRRRLCRLRLGGNQECAGRRARHRARGTDH